MFTGSARTPRCLPNVSANKLSAAAIDLPEIDQRKELIHAIRMQMKNHIIQASAACRRRRGARNLDRPDLTPDSMMGALVSVTALPSFDRVERVLSGRRDQPTVSLVTRCAGVSSPGGAPWPWSLRHAEALPPMACSTRLPFWRHRCCSAASCASSFSMAGARSACRSQLVSCGHVPAHP